MRRKPVVPLEAVTELLATLVSDAAICQLARLERVQCYALRIGIEEVREARRNGDDELARWAVDRCRELIAT